MQTFRRIPRLLRNPPLHVPMHARISAEHGLTIAPETALTLAQGRVRADHGLPISHRTGLTLRSPASITWGRVRRFPEQWGSVFRPQGDGQGRFPQQSGVRGPPRTEPPWGRVRAASGAIRRPWSALIRTSRRRVGKGSFGSNQDSVVRADQKLNGTGKDCFRSNRELRGPR